MLEHILDVARFLFGEADSDVSQAAIVPCHENLLSALQPRGLCETTAGDNLRTLKLVFAAYDSASATERNKEPPISE